jgi:predicted membrane protein
MNHKPSKFFPFKKPFYKDVVFYIFLYFVYERLSSQLLDFVKYGYGNLVLQLFEILIDAVLISWIYSIILAYFRKIILRKWNKRKENKLDVDSNKPIEINWTKIDKPLKDMTEKEREESANKIVNNFLRNYKKSEGKE